MPVPSPRAAPVHLRRVVGTGRAARDRFLTWEEIRALELELLVEQALEVGEREPDLHRRVLDVPAGDGGRHEALAFPEQNADAVEAECMRDALSDCVEHRARRVGSRQARRDLVQVLECGLRAATL